MAKLSDLKPAFHARTEAEQLEILERIRQRREQKLIERRTVKMKTPRLTSEQKAARLALKLIAEMLQKK